MDGIEWSKRSDVAMHRSATFPQQPERWESRDLVVMGNDGWRLRTGIVFPETQVAWMRACWHVSERGEVEKEEVPIAACAWLGVGGEPGEMHGTAGMIGGNWKLLHALRCCVRA